MSEERKNTSFNALELAWSLGYTMAVPLIALALAGRLLDRKFGTSPWLLLAGVLLSIMISSLAVWFRVKKILK